MKFDHVILPNMSISGAQIISQIPLLMTQGAVAEFFGPIFHFRGTQGSGSIGTRGFGVYC